MAISSTKRKRLADPGSGLWLSYSIDRVPGRSVLKRFADPEEEPDSQQAAPGPQAEPAVRERIFTEELRSVTSEVLTHEKPAPAAKQEPAPAPVALPTPAPVAESPRPVEAQPAAKEQALAPEPEREAPAPVAEPAKETAEEPVQAAVAPAEVRQETPPPVAEVTAKAEAEVKPQARPKAGPTSVAEAEQALLAQSSLTEAAGDEVESKAISGPAETVPVEAPAEKQTEEQEEQEQEEKQNDEAEIEEAPDLFEFPDKLDDAEEIRNAHGLRSVQGPRIEDSLSDYDIAESEKDEIELEDPPASESGRMPSPEPVATDAVAKTVPEPVSAPAEPAHEPRTEANDQEIDPHAQVPGRTAIAFQEHEEHERRAEAAHEMEKAEGSGLEMAPDPLHVKQSLEADEDGIVPLPLEKIQANFKQAEYSYPEEFIDLFQKLYSARQLNTEELDPVLEFLLAKSHASAVAWLVLDRKLSSFRPFMDMNLDVNTRKNLYFSMNDRFLPEDEKYEILRFEGTLKDDFHFRKRFSTPFLLGHQGAIVINLNVLQQTSYIILFYRKLPAEDILEELEATSLPIIRDFLPAVQRLQEISETGLRSDHDFADQLYKIGREMTNFGKTPLRILHFVFPGILEKSSRGQLMQQLSKVVGPLLHPDERVVTLLPGRLVVLLKKTDQIAVEEAVQNFCADEGIEVQASAQRYPERGVNLFTYLEPDSGKS